MIFSTKDADGGISSPNFDTIFVLLSRKKTTFLRGIIIAPSSAELCPLFASPERAASARTTTQNDRKCRIIICTEEGRGMMMFVGVPHTLVRRRRRRLYARCCSLSLSLFDTTKRQNPTTRKNTRRTTKRYMPRSIKKRRRSPQSRVSLMSEEERMCSQSSCSRGVKR